MRKDLLKSFQAPAIQLESHENGSWKNTQKMLQEGNEMNSNAVLVHKL